MSIISTSLRHWLGMCIALIATGWLIIGCQPDKDYFTPPPQQTDKLFDQLKADPNFSTFVAALERSKVSLTLANSGLYTVFAPTNAAFQDYFATGPYKSLEEIPLKSLNELVSNHVLSPMMFTFDFGARRFNNKKDDRYQTTARKFVKVIYEANTFTVNGIPVLEKRDLSAANGSIHAIGKMLVPGVTIDSLVKNRPDTRIFARFLKRLAYKEYDPRRSFDLNDDGRIDSVFFQRSLLKLNPVDEDPELTAFAFTDAAFRTWLNNYPQYSIIGQDSVNIPNNVLLPLLNYHIVSGNRNRSALVGVLTTADSERLTATDLSIEQADVFVSNGTLHILNKVAVPPSLGTVGGQILLNRDRDLNLFITALEKVPTLLNDLRNPASNRTVFAPTDDAFRNAGINPVTLSGAQLEPFLRSHIVNSRLSISQLVNGRWYATNNGNGFRYTTNTLTDARGLTADILARDLAGSNGSVHKISNVMSPPNVRILALLLANPDFSELRAALDRTGLTATVEGAGPFTLFAPTNQAFRDFYTQLGVTGLTAVNSAFLRDVLTYHLLGSRVFSTDLVAGTRATLLTGRSLTIRSASGVVTLVDGNAVSPDATLLTSSNQQGINGFIHAIDKVLQP